MDDEQLDDLKQFVASTVSQTEQRLLEELDVVRSEMKDGFSVLPKQ